MRVVIDRFEGEYAVVELPDRSMVNIPVAVLDGAKEGDVVEIRIDLKETEKRRTEIQGLMEELWND
jgi:hypothetical protein